ncbi:uncharacterized protein LOC132446172 [Gadus macrocephalus]|uniref:uncharacterized protein LOC132446172 n=1 Tax=Gadus macrocephalus TaxID=80720 RepID=UPI0028CB87F5|nr:uncharacterized protein LOC132446172 [Gadus macrocephalus]
MGSEEWVSRLKAFASSGTWPSSAGNRPSPKQAKWHNLYQKIEKCPMMLRGQTLILGIAQTCTCGFHSQQSVRSPAATSASTSAAPARSPGRPALTLAMMNISITLNTMSFTWLAMINSSQICVLRTRFGGTLSAAAKPNVNVTRRPVERPSSPATVPAERSTPSATPPRVTPPSSPSFYRPVSPFSLPPSSPVMSAVRTSSSPLVVSDMSPAPPGLLPAPLGLPAAPPGPLPAPPGPLPAPPLTAPDQFWLPVEMRKTIPQQDQRWIASTLWRNQRPCADVQLWYEPPDPALIYNQVPSPDRFFMHRLLVWMPYHLWKVRLSCPQCKGQLTGAGIHKRARKVLDVDRYYLMVTETLRCNSSSCVSN